MVKVHIDASALDRCAVAFREVGFEVTQRIVVRALNRTGDKTTTDLKRQLSKITGERVGRVAQAFKKHRAKPGNLTFTIDAKDKWERITAGNFRAREVRAGVRHRAWGKTVTARGAFMIGGAAVARRGNARLPLKPLYGPNIAREMLRDERGQVSGTVYVAVQKTFTPRVLHETDRALKAAKATYRL